MKPDWQISNAQVYGFLQQLVLYPTIITTSGVSLILPANLWELSLFFESVSDNDLI
jgi:hypothetical protein